jgi:hypothetical protein
LPSALASYILFCIFYFYSTSIVPGAPDEVDVADAPGTRRVVAVLVDVAVTAGDVVVPADVVGPEATEVAHS